MRLWVLLVAVVLDGCAAVEWPALKEIEAIDVFDKLWKTSQKAIEHVISEQMRLMNVDELVNPDGDFTELKSDIKPSLIDELTHKYAQVLSNKEKPLSSLLHLMSACSEWAPDDLHRLAQKHQATQLLADALEEYEVKYETIAAVIPILQDFLSEQSERYASGAEPDAKKPLSARMFELLHDMVAIMDIYEPELKELESLRDELRGAQKQIRFHLWKRPDGVAADSERYEGLFLMTVGCFPRQTMQDMNEVLLKSGALDEPLTDQQQFALHTQAVQEMRIRRDVELVNGYSYLVAAPDMQPDFELYTAEQGVPPKLLQRRQQLRTAYAGRLEELMEAMRALEKHIELLDDISEQKVTPENQPTAGSWSAFVAGTFNQLLTKELALEYAYTQFSTAATKLRLSCQHPDEAQQFIEQQQSDGAADELLDELRAAAATAADYDGYELPAAGALHSAQPVKPQLLAAKDEL